MKANVDGAYLTLRERQRLEREDSILDAALDLMRDSGYTVMTMDDLAARVGISKPTLYTHFASKEEIAVRTIVRMMQRGIAFIEEHSAVSPAIRRLELVVRHLFERKFIQHIHLGTARDALGPTMRENPAYQVEYRRMLGLLSECIDQAKAEGAIKSELSTRIAVQNIISLLRDAEYQELLASGECQPQELVDTLTVILLDGMKAQQTK